MEREQGPVEHEQELRELFATIDADHNGVLTRAEVAQFAAQLDAPLSEHELDAAMAEMDADGSGDVDIEELLKWCGARKTVSPLKELQAQFRKFDLNGSGRIDRVEMRKVLASIGFAASEAEVQRMINQSSPRATIDFPTFLTILGMSQRT